MLSSSPTIPALCLTHPGQQLSVEAGVHALGQCLQQLQQHSPQGHGVVLQQQGEGGDVPGRCVLPCGIGKLHILERGDGGGIKYPVWGKWGRGVWQTRQISCAANVDDMWVGKRSEG